MTVLHERDDHGPRRQPAGRGRRAVAGLPRPAAVAVSAVVATLTLLAACGTEGDGTPGDATAPSGATSSQETSPSGTTADSPRPDDATGATADDAASESTKRPSGFPEGTGLRRGKGSGDALVLTDVRVKEHYAFDRIVLEFSGTGTPGWAVTYVKQAALEGSGEVVELDGDSTLNISASNSTWPADDYYSGPLRLGGDDGAPDVHVGGTFEGYTQVLAGVDGPRAPFRVFTRTQPSRLVVDITTDD